MTIDMELYAIRQGREIAEKLLKGMHNNVIQFTRPALAYLVTRAMLRGMHAAKLHYTKTEPHADMYEWRY